jgi:2-octaprenyl-6-methoxyphenol hydroxylase
MSEAPAEAPAQTHAKAPAAGAPPALILGGGPVGLVCALLLARAAIACSLVDARPLEAAQRERRLLALSRGSLLLLESLLGRDFAPLAPIERVRVSSSGEPGAALLGAQDFGGDRLGATVWYADLVGALAAAAQAQEARLAPGGGPLLRVLRPRRALGVEQSPNAVRVTLDDGAALCARVAIDAEGTPARAPQARHVALLAEIELAGVAPGEAIERFTREGPLALLPLPGPSSLSSSLSSPLAAQDGVPDGLPRRLSMVWCQPAAQGQARLQLDEAALRGQIARALGPRLGTPTWIGARQLVPLTTHRLASVVEHRRVALGNAAQSLHPVAGQGFNLGLRDCASLAEAMIDAGVDAGADPLLALGPYARARRLDRSVLPALTSLLPPLFATRLAPVAAARAAGLVAIDTLPVLRRAFTRLLMFGAG